MHHAMLILSLVLAQTEPASSFRIVEEAPLPDATAAEIAVEAVQAGGGPPLPVRAIVTGRDGSHPDGSGMEVLATGVRNTQGFDWHPKTGEMWFTDHGRDWMGDNGPEDELNRLAKNGEFFGYPYCHAKGVVDADIKKKDACKGVTLPVTTMGPHAAVMGVKFYTGSMFPKEYQNTMFIARKGSWNRTVKFGFDVVNVRPSANCSTPYSLTFHPFSFAI